MGFAAFILPLLCLHGACEAWVSTPLIVRPSSLASHQRQWVNAPSLRPSSSHRPLGAAARPSPRRGGGAVRMGAEGAGKKFDEIEFIDDLLCQRAVQTQLSYFEEFRDGYKKVWLEEFGDHVGMSKVHAFGMLNNTNLYLSDMLNSPPQENEIFIQWGNRFAGGSKDNPYINREKQEHSYNETVHPQKIVQGIMQIREQLALEWVEDLALLEEDDMIFWQELAFAFDDSNPKPEAQPKPDLAWTGGMEAEEEEEGTFDYSRNLILSHVRAAGRSSTPLRARNYDLIKQAGTWVAAKRLIDGRDKDDAEGSWLSAWFDVNSEKLVGDSRVGASEDFLKMLAEQPSRSVMAGKKLIMIDPKEIAEKIVEGRSSLISKWVRWLGGDHVKNGHTEIMRSLLIQSVKSEKNKT